MHSYWHAGVPGILIMQGNFNQFYTTSVLLVILILMFSAEQWGWCAQWVCRVTFQILQHCLSQITEHVLAGNFGPIDKVTHLPSMLSSVHFHSETSVSYWGAHGADSLTTVYFQPRKVRMLQGGVTQGHKTTPLIIMSECSPMTAGWYIRHSSKFYNLKICQKLVAILCELTCLKCKESNGRSECIKCPVQ